MLYLPTILKVKTFSAEEMDSRAQVFVSVKSKDMTGAFAALKKGFCDVRAEGEYIRIYDVDDTARIVDYMMKCGHIPSEIRKNKIGLREYYIELMSGGQEK